MSDFPSGRVSDPGSEDAWVEDVVSDIDVDAIDAIDAIDSIGLMDGEGPAVAREPITETVDPDDVLVLDEVDDPELVLPMWEPTGEPRVDGALDALSRLDGIEVAEHATVFAEVHGGLRQVLADLDADRL